MPDAHFTMYAQFVSTEIPPKGLQIARYSNPEIDELLTRAMTELDEGKRRELYCRATEIVWRDAPWIFLHAQKYFLAANARVKGIFVFVDGEQFYFHKAYKVEG